jgi:hypothetical protein
MIVDATVIKMSPQPVWLTGRWVGCCPRPLGAGLERVADRARTHARRFVGVAAQLNQVAADITKLLALASARFNQIRIDGR